MTFDMPSFKLHWEVGRSNHFGESGRSPPLPSVSCLDLATMCHLQYMLIVSWHNLFLWCIEWSIEILVLPAFQKKSLWIPRVCISILLHYFPGNVRSPSRIAISRSYPRHLFKFCEKPITSLFSFASFSLKRHNFL